MAEEQKTAETAAETEEMDPILLEKQVESLEATVAEEKDKYLRLLAEYENFRRRSKQEKDALYTDAYADALTLILPILDNLERASAYTEGEQIKTGLEMITKQFADVLTKMGVTEIPTETFDPHVHNAVMHVEDESAGENAVVEVFQKGYQRGDRVIRFAMVKVAN